MNPDQILDMIGDARGEYILQTQRHRAVTAKKTHLNLHRSLLIAAVIGLMLLLVGCTIAYTQGWFVSFFQKNSDTPLTPEQISYLEENEQRIGESNAQKDWTVELRSALSDGTTGYIIIGITAPEGTNLEPRIKDGRILDRFGPGNSGMGSAEKPDIITTSKTVAWNRLTSSWEEDGDGLSNTKNFVLQIHPDLERCTVEPFGPEAVYHIYLEDIVRDYDDEEYRQHLLDTKYAGQDAIMFTQEEILRMHQREVLLEGIWEFDVTFTDPAEATPKQELELLTAPIHTEADILRRYGEELWECAYFREEVTVTSALLRPLGLTLTYEDCNGWPTFYFHDEDLFVEEDICAYAVMTDTSRIRLQDWGNGSSGYKVLDAESPIVPEMVDYILLPDGTQLYPNGTTIRPPKKALPAAAADYQTISSESGLYAHYGDFDRDGTDDMALWYDGGFHTLCLLNPDGTAKASISLEAGSDVYETYNQRSSEIKYEPNLIKLAKTEGSVSTLQISQTAEDGLHLREAVRRDSADNQHYRFDPDTSAWETISEEVYQQMTADYQVMQYHLYPIR